MGSVAKSLPKPPDFGSLSRFELYSIVIENLDEEKRDLKEILLDRYGIEYCLYKRRDGEVIPTKVPLLLKGPRRPTLAYDPINIVFGEDWLKGFDYEQNMKEFNKPLTIDVRDRISKSCAKISYEMISHSVEARLVFKFEDSQGRRIQIIKGEIAAYTGMVPIARRVLRSFVCSENPDPKRSGDSVVDLGKPVHLDKPVIAFPFGGELCVEVDLTCSVSSPSKKMKPEGDGMMKPDDDEVKPEDGVITEIKGIQVFKAPEAPGNEENVYRGDLEGLYLNLEVTWFDSGLRGPTVMTDSDSE